MIKIKNLIIDPTQVCSINPENSGFQIVFKNGVVKNFQSKVIEPLTFDEFSEKLFEEIHKNEDKNFMKMMAFIQGNERNTSNT